MSGCAASPSASLAPRSLAADCAADGVYEFLLEASPEPFVHALGAPVNPIAIK